MRELSHVCSKYNHKNDPKTWAKELEIMSRANAVSEIKSSIRKFDFLALVKQFKEFSWIKNKLNLERTMNGFEKPLKKPKNKKE